MKRTSPLTQMTLALVALAGTLVLLANLFFGVIPDRAAQQRELRKTIAENLAVQVTELLRTHDAPAIERTLAAIAARTDGVRSIGVRRAVDQALLVHTGDHARLWQPLDDERSKAHQVIVPLSADGGRWGSFEIAFAPDERNLLLRVLTEPLTLTLLFVSIAGTLVFGLYMRRALQHLDPASVIPERVQGAFDAMAEGVVVLDTRGRVLLSNKAFRALHGDAAALRSGSALSALPWLAGGLPDDSAQHAWTRAMTERAPNAGTTLVVGTGDDGQRHLVINAAPVCDPGGRVRGCMVTFNDVSELHRSNAALRDALDALSASKAEVERKNRELHQLATRDPLTGCLNRRAFDDALRALLHGHGSEPVLLGCVMLDIDHFKRVNDQHGHGVGDRVIQEVAKKLQECSRATDLVCRSGGEEFCVVVPGVDVREVMAFAERVRERVERECGAAVREVDGLRVTISAGVDAARVVLGGTAPLIQHADQALYSAKRGGRNRVHRFATEAEPAGPGAEARLDAAAACLTRDAFVPAFAALRQRARVEGATIGCVMFGLEAPDAVEPGAGDAAAALTAAVALLRTALAPGDLIARHGDRRIAVVLPRRGPQDAADLAERMCARLDEEPALRQAGLVASAGVDALPAHALGAPTLPDRAEQALARARRQGRQRVSLFAPTPHTASSPPDAGGGRA